eukprot:1571197-Pleurochrysis_carterae.AAC.1
MRIARGLCRGQALKEQESKEAVGLRRRERVGVISREEGSRFAHIQVDREGKLEVSERLGQSNGPVAPDFA